MTVDAQHETVAAPAARPLRMSYEVYLAEVRGLTPEAAQSLRALLGA